MKFKELNTLQGAQIPRHIAIIMDGNGRWAKAHRLTRFRGHRHGAEAVRRAVTACRELGVEVLTLYAFSEENWNRPGDEIKALLKILKEFLVSERELLQKKDVRLRAIGDLSRLPEEIREILNETLELTRDHKSMSLVLALSYGGRDEIVRAVRSIAMRVAKGGVRPEQINQHMISQELDTAGLPDPDLLIRTSGEFRTSNFLPWQTIYTEFYVTPMLWPDFTIDELCRAILDFNRRERRYGRTSEQLIEAPTAQWIHAQ
ncbi:MAG TPA: isoprenyl transferase [Bdellovibrionota bacterium]|nr:isoprenyl transferase [Bdellovibrionota bacterium]